MPPESGQIPRLLLVTCNPVLPAAGTCGLAPTWSILPSL